MNRRYMRNIRTVSMICLLSLIPLIWLGIYNFPSADDFSTGYFTHKAWMETGSFWEVIKAAFFTSLHLYGPQGDGGLYSSVFFMSLHPGVFGEKYYFLTVFITVGSLLLANLIFAWLILSRVLKLSVTEAVYAGILSATLMIQKMPSGVEGIYWYDGAMNYTCFFALLLMMVSVHLYANSVEITDKKRRIVSGSAAAVLAFILSGGNHVTAFGGLLYLTGALLVQIIRKKEGLFFSNVLPFAFSVYGFVLNITSPGTRARQAHFAESYGVVKSIIYASIVGCDHINAWFSMDVLLLILLLFPVMLRLTTALADKGFRFRYPLLVLIFSVGFDCALLCPPFYAMGSEGAGRLTNVVFFTYVLLLLFNAVYVLGWIRKHLTPDLTERLKEMKWLRSLLVPLFLCTAILVLGGRKTNGYEALEELVSGEAKVYGRENEERYEFLGNTELKDVIVPDFSVKPQLLYFDDITPDAEDWKNRACARYYDLETVRKDNDMGGTADELIRLQSLLVPTKKQST